MAMTKKTDKGVDAAELSSGNGVSSRVVEAVRSTSATAGLIRLSRLKELFPNDDVGAVIEGSGALDLKKMTGTADVYFFSDETMTEAYALHLFRVEENDPVKLVADTVRDDSRIYPRPTDVRGFLEAPFSLTRDVLDGTLLRMGERQDMADIKTCLASNGARYLYSDRYLGDAQAQSLTEWIEVLQKENP